MKFILVSLPFLILSCFCYGQDDILFQSTIFFEDSIGNRDSIVFGFAENEGIDIINPIYGEEELNTPFDSIFEVRASHFNSGRKPYTKKIITHVLDVFYDPDEMCFDFAASPYFVIQARHFPIKISWKPSDFQNMHCIKGSMIVGHAYPFIIDNWFLDEKLLMEAACLATDSIMYRLENADIGDSFEVEVEIEGNRTARAKEVFFLFRSDEFFEGLCKSEEPNSTNNPARLPELSPFPNPVESRLNFGINKESTFEIIDIKGMVIKTGRGIKANLENLQNGFYFLQVEGFAPQRFIKM